MSSFLNNSEQILKFQGLYIIALPIGNLKDITLRAIDTLKSVDYIICEDTRVTNILLQSYDIKKSLLVYNDHSNEKDRNKIINLLISGNNIALVSDAGTPLIADPGYKLIIECYKNDIYVESLPGPSSVITALTLAQQPTDRFQFLGFLPNKSIQKENFITDNILTSENTTIVFESANRLLDTLEIFAKIYNRYFSNTENTSKIECSKEYDDKIEITILRELTKKFQEVKKGTLKYLIEYYANNPARGEIIIIIPSNKNHENSLSLYKEQIQFLKQSNLSNKDITEYFVKFYNCNKKIIYDYLIK